VQLLPQSLPSGYVLYRSIREVLKDSRLYAYHHLISVAWEGLELDSVLCINNLPTVYIHRSEVPVAPEYAARLHKRFWNQGLATLFLLIDPSALRVYSAQAFPASPAQEHDFEAHPALIETNLDLAATALWLEKLYIQLETGAYYREHATFFDKSQSIDEYLLENLSATRDLLTEGNAQLKKSEAHAFLGRILFTCYLVDRGIIRLSDYLDCEGESLLEWLSESGGSATKLKEELYSVLFPKLRRQLNGSMFDDALEDEQKRIKPRHIELLKDFLSGAGMRSRQLTLGFWAYEFQMIPVETISGIYEDFLKAEGEDAKHKAGAYYTPRLLAEMTLDVMFEGRPKSLLNKTFLDPSCGSGIFLVLLFNRLAAEWTHANSRKSKNYVTKAEALRDILRYNIRGVDINPTACRIACFSLYLAYLDQFAPRAIEHHSKETGRFLPNLIRAKGVGQPKGPRELIPVITEADFLQNEDSLGSSFDYIVGNPPWAERGNSLEQQFMLGTPTRMGAQATACMLLPTKVLLNQTSAFQGRWLEQVSIEKIVQLADYRRILFAEAKCPCLIARFKKADAKLQDSWIEYLTPKVRGIEVRNGSVPVCAEDRKWLSENELRSAISKGHASQLWKSLFWGTDRDRKLLSCLCGFPRLGDLAGTPKQVNAGKKKWVKGQGFQPLKIGECSEKYRKLRWSLQDTFVPARKITDSPFIFESQLPELGTYLEEHSYRLDCLHRERDETIYQPPLILFSQGFTRFAYFDYPVRFQDSLQSIAGRPGDEDELLFLAAYLKSKLAYYFIFHTTSNIGAERPKAHLKEVLDLPFFLPDGEFASPESRKLIKEVSTQMRALKGRLMTKWEKLAPSVDDEFELSDETEADWEAFAERETKKLMEQFVDPLIYQYFGLIQAEIDLVEDTHDVIRPSITPSKVDDRSGTRQLLSEESFKEYAQTLVATLQSWIPESVSVKINAICRVHPTFELSCVELYQSSESKDLSLGPLADSELAAYLRLEASSSEDNGSMRLIRSVRYFEGDRIRIYKPARLGFWMKSSALNDASALHAEIMKSSALNDGASFHSETVELRRGEE